jgi:hypothetical protein
MGDLRAGVGRGQQVKNLLVIGWKMVCIENCDSHNLISVYIVSPALFERVHALPFH